jgi:iron complex outermembrane receptor protein
MNCKKAQSITITHPRIPMKKLPRTRQTGLVAISMLAVATPLYAQDQSHNLNIGPQSVAGALKALANQTHLQIVSDGSALQGRQTQGVKGLYTNRAAMQKLLAGTGLTYTFTADNAVAVKPDPKQLNKAEPTTLKPMIVSAERDYADTDPFNPDYVIPDATSGTKTDTPIMETPLNVQVISHQVLRDQQVIQVDQALKNISGVTTTTNVNSGGDQQFFLRGFASNTLFRNGVRFDNNLFGANQQLANVERIEVLKGPAAILYGRVEPGGMVNIITKQPLATPYYSFNQQFGSYDLYRTSIDATGPLTKDDSLLYRMNMSYQNSGSFRDLMGVENVFLAPVLRWNISPRTQATLEMEYQHENSNSDNQFLPLQDNHLIDLPHSRNLGERNPQQTDTYFVGLNWSHQFNDDWSIKHNVVWKRQDINAQYAFPDNVDLANRQVNRSVFSNNLTIDRVTTSLDLTGHFNTWGLEHTLLFGGDYYYFNNAINNANSTTSSTISIDDPIHPGPNLDTDPSTRSLFSTNTDNYGLYLQDQIKLPYHVHVMGGLRYQYVHSTSGFGLLNDVFTPDPAQTDDAVTPRVGLLWNPQSWVSLYSNYAENFGANSGLLALGNKLLPPESAQQWEVGAKTEFFDGRLRATLAYYDITKQNVATTDTAHPVECNGGPCSIAIGEVRSQGPELDIQGELLPGWNLIATYANQDVRVTKSNNGDVGNRLQFVPRNVGSVWTTYEVQQGPLDGFKIGGGVNMQDGVVNADNTFKSPGYALVGLMTGYSFKAGKSRITAQLNVNNLLDKTYFTNATPYGPTDVAPLGSLALGTFSTPRTFMGSINIQY